MKKSSLIQLRPFWGAVFCATAITLICANSVFAAERFIPKSEKDIDILISKMSVREKVGQLNYIRINTANVNMEQMVLDGDVGGFPNVRDHKLREKLERIAVEKTRLGIPLLHGADVIHGYRTIFPIPLGLAATWNTELVEKASRLSAEEGSKGGGIRWYFTPMLDVCRDPRWGRIAETHGEDPFLSGEIGAAIVRGFQGDDLANPNSVAACPKHYVGYGASEGGRDYNTVDISERTLREIHLPPFKAAIDAGALTIMGAFSNVNGEPASASRFLLTDILRGEWGFHGFVVSDAKAIDQLVPHGLVKDTRDAAAAAINAGMDIELIGSSYNTNLQKLVEDGVVSMDVLDEAVRRVLRVKWKLGLFENPIYPSSGPDSIALTDEGLELSREAARQSLVLLKNDKGVLPLSNKVKSIAVIGPLANAPKDQMGMWTVYGKTKDVQTPLQALRQKLGNDRVKFAMGMPSIDSRDASRIPEAVEAARDADLAIVFVGEPASYTGEAHNRAYLTLPGVQSQMLKTVSETGKPVIVVMMSGRPLEISQELELMSALLVAWHPGTMGGPAIVDALFGDYNPSGRLPFSWPRTVGQIPIHYNHFNTGRPNLMEFSPTINADTQLDTSHVTGYIDLPTVPQFPFGYGLSYTSFHYENIQLSPTEIAPFGRTKVSVKVTNTGKVKGEEVVQLYIRDKVASVPRPVRELKAFTRVSLNPGESKTVELTLEGKSLAFHDRNMQQVIESGSYEIWVGRDSASGISTELEVR